MDITFAIITCSDTRTIFEDTAGLALARLIGDEGWTVASHVVVKDERGAIAEAIVEAADSLHADVVLAEDEARHALASGVHAAWVDLGY